MQPFGPPRQPLSILLVEQDELLRAATGRMLEADGHRVVRACAGREAAVAIRQEKFDLLVIDVLFPGEGTLQAVVEWSRTPGRGRILGLCRFSRILPDYYLLLTGKLGMRVILPKPFDRAQLAEAIDEVAADDRANWRGGACAAVHNFIGIAVENLPPQLAIPLSCGNMGHYPMMNLQFHLSALWRRLSRP